MADTIRIRAEKRTEFGKGAARRIRRADMIPAVMYGSGSDPVHIALPGHDTMMALKHVNALINIELDGGEQLALAKDVQRDPIKAFIEHVDFVVVKRGQKVQVEVPVHLDGEAAPETVATTDHQTLLLEVEATHIPEQLVVSIEGLEAGTQVHASDVELPLGAELVTDEDALVVNISQQQSEEELEAELAETEAELGIEHEESEEEGGAPAAVEDAEGSEEGAASSDQG